MTENAVALAALALCGTLATGFFSLLTKLSRSIDKNTQAHEVVAKTNQEIAEAVKKQSRESEKRNGHLGEQNEQITRLIIESKKDIIESTTHIDKQEVDNSTVKKLVVEEK